MKLQESFVRVGMTILMLFAFSNSFAQGVNRPIRRAASVGFGVGVPYGVIGVGGEYKMGLIGIKKFRNFDVSHNQVKNKNKSPGFSRFQYKPRISLSANFFSGFGLPQKSPVSAFLEKTETKRNGATETQKGDHIRVGDGVGFGGSLRLDLFSHVSIRANYNNLLVSFGLKDVEAEGMKQELRDKTNVEELSFELIIRPVLSRNSNAHFYFGGGIARMAAKYSLKSNISLPRDSNWLSESFDYN